MCVRVRVRVYQPPLTISPGPRLCVFVVTLCYICTNQSCTHRCACVRTCVCVCACARAKKSLYAIVEHALHCHAAKHRCACVCERVVRACVCVPTGMCQVPPPPSPAPPFPCVCACSCQAVARDYLRCGTCVCVCVCVFWCVCNAALMHAAIPGFKVFQACNIIPHTNTHTHTHTHTHTYHRLGIFRQHLSVGPFHRVRLCDTCDTGYYQRNQ